MAGYFFWFRDSSLVAVSDVEVVGVTSQRDPIVAEMTRVAEGMSTLNPDRGAIEQAALAFPTVKSVAIDPNFPHGLRLEFVERRPAMVLLDGDEKVSIAADGTILTGVPAPEEGVPELELEDANLGARALDGDALDQAIAVGAAPDPLRPLIEAVELTKDYGIVLTLRGGIPVRFGDAGNAIEKWRSVAAVLADPKLEALSYIDIRVAERPAIGDNAGLERGARRVEPPVRPKPLISTTGRGFRVFQNPQSKVESLALHDPVRSRIAEIDIDGALPYGHSHVQTARSVNTQLSLQSRT